VQQILTGWRYRLAAGCCGQAPPPSSTRRLGNLALIAVPVLALLLARLLLAGGPRAGQIAPWLPE
jgi:hypothetical protein